MKKILTMTLASFLIAGPALADDDCNEPVADWQPREVLQKQLEDKGWQVKRIKVDDGCYEVKGIDRNGNRFEAVNAFHLVAAVIHLDSLHLPALFISEEHTSELQ